MTQITDEMVHKAIDAYKAESADGAYQFLGMTAALEAALAVAPAVSPGRTSEPATDEEVDAEWEGFWKPIVAPTGEVDPDLVKLELYDFSQLIANAAEVYCHVTGGMISKVTTLPRQVIAVADDHMNKVYDEYAEEAVAPDPAPDDAFEAALDVLITQSEFLGSVRDTSTKDDVEDVHAARQRILALHRQATHAGLRELRAWCATRQGWTTIIGADDNAQQAVIEKIDAMLKEATDES